MKKAYWVMQILALILLIDFFALSAHVLILQYFNAPAININPKFNQFIDFMIRFFTVVGAVFIYFLSREYWNKIKLFYRVILFALLIMALAEQLLRAPIMEIISGVPLEYQVVSTIPSYVSWLMLSLFIAFFIMVSFCGNILHWGFWPPIQFNLLRKD